MLTVHHLGVSMSERIIWLCEELEIPYQLLKYDRDPDTRMAPPAYKALHPFGTAPAITDGDLVLGETGAIIEYIIAVHGGGRLKPASDSPDFADFLYWYHFTGASFMPAMSAEMMYVRMGVANPAMPQGARSRTVIAFEMIEKRLGESDYFAGDAFTAADIMMVFPLTTLRLFMPRDFTDFPNIRAYLKRVGERPAYLRAMAKGDPEMKLMLE